MTKPGKMTQVEQFYIENNLSKTVEEIAKDLDRTEKFVQKHIDSLPKESITKAKKERKQMNKLMGHRREATVMTPAASELSDEIRKNKSKNKKSNVYHLDNVIHKPMD